MMRLKVILWVFVAGILFIGCSSSKIALSTNTELDHVMEAKAFEIKVRSVQPQLTQAMSQIANSGILPPGNSISRIDVTGEGYFIKVQGDSVSANLPYYGERQMGGGYNENGGVVFDGLVNDLEITKDDRTFSYSVRFSIRAASETFDVNTRIGTKWFAVTDIRSSHRNRISYTGDVKDLVKSP